MNKKLLLPLLLLGGCASSPYAVIDGTQSQISDENNYDVTIVSIDGKMQFGKQKKNVKPGFHYINVLTTKKLRSKNTEVQMFPVDAKECMRYEVSAQHKNGIADEWEVKLLREVPIPSCTPSEKSQQVAKIPAYLTSSSENVCLDKGALANSYTPADLYPSIKLCIDEGKQEHAIYSYMLASAYSLFDAKRVVDKTAHQAIELIQKHSIWTLTALEQDKFQQKLTAFIDSPESMQAACSFLQSVGKPAYSPDYMVEHGVKRITAEHANGIDKNFQADITWKTTLISQLKCRV